MTDPQRQGETTVDLTPGPERRLPPGEHIGSETYERWRRTPNRDAYMAAMMIEAGRVAYRAGREGAARDIQELAATLCMDGTGRHLVDTCAQIARGEQLP